MVLICKEDVQVSIFDPVTMTRTDVVAPSLPDGAKNTVTRVVTCQKHAWVVTGERFLWQAPAAAVAVNTSHLHPIFSLATTVQ